MKPVCAAALVLGTLAFVGQEVIDHLQASRTGVSANMFIIEKDGQLFVTGRGGGPVELRPKWVISRENYEKYLAYHQVSGALGTTCMLLWFAGLVACAVSMRHRAQCRKGQCGFE